MLAIHLEYFGTIIGLFSVISASGVTVGGHRLQVVRWESAGLVTLFCLTFAWQLKRDLAHKNFKK